MSASTGLSIALAGLALVAVAACSKQPQATGERPTRSVGSVIAPSPADTSAPVRRDTALPSLVRLEREARALARTDGCKAAGACRTAPVGWRGCGGPRAYVIYCAATTDTVALFAKLAELEKAERAYNANSGMMSTCELRTPPVVRLDGQRCREAGTGP